LTEAVNEELVESNPMAGWTYKRKAAPTEEDEVDPFSQEHRAILPH
jgi:integrase